MRTEATNWRLVGRRIRALRRQKGLSQEELAAPDYSAAYMSHVEHGNRRPSHEAVTHIAERLGVTVDHLLTGRDPHEDIRLEIAVQEAIGQIHAGEAATARDVLEKALSRALKAGYAEGALRAREGLGLALYRLGDLEGASAVYSRAEHEASGASAEDLTLVRVGRARCLFQLGRPREAIHVLESHLIELRAGLHPDPTALTATYAALIPPYFEVGLIEQAKEAASEGWQLAVHVDDPEQRACLYVNRAQVLLAQGEPRAALASLALAQDGYRALGWYEEAAKLSLARALVLIDEGKLEDARSALESGLAARTITPTDEAQALTQLALINRRTGDPRAGLSLCDRAVTLAEAVPAAAAEAHREAGLCSLALDDRPRALASWRKALDLYRSAGNHDEIAKTARLLGDHLMDEGDAVEAARVYREGLASLGELH